MPMNLFPDKLDDGTRVEVLIVPRGIRIYKKNIGGEQIPLSTMSFDERIRLEEKARSIESDWDEDEEPTPGDG